MSQNETLTVIRAKPLARQRLTNHLPIPTQFGAVNSNSSTCTVEHNLRAAPQGMQSMGSARAIQTEILTWARLRVSSDLPPVRAVVELPV